jgi:hypothetical protein
MSCHEYVAIKVFKPYACTWIDRKAIFAYVCNICQHYFPIFMNKYTNNNHLVFIKKKCFYDTIN